MKPSPSVSLARISSEVRTALAAASDATLRVAALVLQAKEVHFASSALAWLEWCRKEFRFSRRYCFMLARVADYMRRLDDLPRRAVQHAALLEVTKVEILAAIPPDRLPAFLKAVDVSDLERDELRDAVHKFLGTARRATQQLDFFAELRLPPPEVFKARLGEAIRARSVPPRQAFEYGTLLMASALEQSDLLSPADRRDLFAVLDALLTRARGHAGD